MKNTVTITNEISVDIAHFAKRNKTNDKLNDIYISFSIYNKGLRQFSPHTISTEISVERNKWSNGQIVTGRDDKAKINSGKLTDYFSAAKNMVDELRLKNVKVCSQLNDEIKANAKQRVIGKVSKHQKKNLISRLKEYSYQDVMNFLLEKKKISAGRSRGYNSSHKLLEAFYNGVIPPIDQITTESLEQFMEWIEVRTYTKGKTTKLYNDYSKTTIKSKIAAVIKYAIKPMKIITVNPLPAGFRGKWVEDAKKDILDEIEMYAFMLEIPLK